VDLYMYFHDAVTFAGEVAAVHGDASILPH
jgi:hypothetical protein